MTTKGYVPYNADGSIPNACQILATVPNVDLTIATDTILYTVPAGKQFFLEDVIFQTITVDAYAAAPSISVGSNAANYNNWIFDHAVGIDGTDNLDTVNKAVSMRNVIVGSNQNPTSSFYQAGDVIKLHITGAASATALITTIRITGYLI
jgi:hypothetical protein